MSVRTELHDDFMAGILLIAPLAVTLLVLWLLVDWTSVVIDPLVAQTRLARYTSNIDILAKVLAGGIVVLTVTAIGYASRHPIGIGLQRAMGRVPALVPFVGTIYTSVRQVASAIGEEESRFKRLVLLEYPTEDVYSLGLLTAEAPSALQEEGEPMRYSVYLPNSPNPTGGRTVIVPEDRFEDVDMSVQAGLKLMLTTGMSHRDTAQ
ncbi:MAG: DUF502 domain-containing protein [Candidatus Nanohaloarchaea archaeon]|nr:DUF502 domain-containing protein [Candidatus Nanohaloarchaea archaeon]